MRSIVQLILGTRIAEKTNGRAASFHFPRVPSGRAGAVTSLGLSFSRHLRARAPSPDYPPVSYPRAVLTAAAAWRTSADFPVGRVFHSIEKPARKSAAARSGLKRMASGVRSGTGLGLPHHRRLYWPAVSVLAGLAAFWCGVGAVVWWLV